MSTIRITLPRYSDEEAGPNPTADEQRLVEALWAAIEADPDFVYPKFDGTDLTSEVNLKWYGEKTRACLYTGRNGEPLCVVGHALFRLDPNFLPRYGDYSSAEQVIDRLQRGGRLRLGSTGWSQAFARAIQRGQDVQLSWKRAWDGAVEFLWEAYSVKIEVLP